MSIILISLVLVMKFTNSFLVSCRSISYNNYGSDLVGPFRTKGGTVCTNNTVVKKKKENQIEKIWSTKKTLH